MQDRAPTTNHALTVEGLEGNQLLADGPWTGRVIFRGKGNTATIHRSFDGDLVFLESGAQVTIEPGEGILVLTAHLYTGDVLVWGRGSRSYGCRIWVGGGRTCRIGGDCLFAESVSIRTTDNHALIDLASGEHLNPPDDVSIGDHVWLGHGVHINKGVTIGDGSVVGSESVVTHPIPPTELWAGVPAKQIRTAVSWVDAQLPRPEEVGGLCARFPAPSEQG